LKWIFYLGHSKYFAWWWWWCTPHNTAEMFKSWDDVYRYIVYTGHPQHCPAIRPCVYVQHCRMASRL